MEKEHVIAEFGSEFNDLKVVIASQYEIYRILAKCRHNKILPYKDWAKDKEKELYRGICIHNSNTIYICDDIRNKYAFEETLRHELIHVFLEHKAPDFVKWDEEMICEIFSKHHDYYVELVNKVCDVCMKKIEM